MIRIEEKDQLSGAEKFGDCINCGDNGNVVKVTFFNKDSTQQHSIRLCMTCASILADDLNNIVKSK